MNRSNCPKHDQLVEFVAGSLPSVAFEGVAAHVESCADCDRAVDSISGGTGFFSALKKAAATGPDDLEQEAECADALERAQQALTSEASQDETFVSGTADTVKNKPDQPAIGSEIGPYELLEPIGAGGMGTVFKARHAKLNKVVALKLLPQATMARADHIARFEREMLATGSLDHRNIVGATDAGEADGVHYLAMEFIEGIDLSQLVANRGPLPVPGRLHAKSFVEEDLFEVVGVEGGE